MSSGTLLMEPGPTMVDDRVIQALCTPVVYHQSPEFAQTMDEICERLRGIYGTRSGDVIILPASGRGALEAVLTSVREVGRPFVVPTNGTFGRMMATIGRSVGLDVTELRRKSGEVVPRAEIESTLKGCSRPILGIVHNETATGMVNELHGYAELVRQHDGLLVVDAVSSLGGAEFVTDDLGIDFCVSATQKSMGAPAGLSFVSVSGRGRNEIESRSDLHRGNYLDLRRWWDIWVSADHGGRLNSGYRRLPWTMPTHLAGALLRACELIDDEGLKQRWRRHQRIGEALRAGLRELGMTILAPSGSESDTVTAFTSAGLEAKEIRRRLDERYGVRLATGMDDDAQRVLRIAHMAETARPGPQVQTLAALAEELGGRSARLADPVHTFLDVWHR